MPEKATETLGKIRNRAIARIGRVVADYRGRKGLVTQDNLAEQAGTTRTVIAHLEEGRELPTSDILSVICDRLNVPQQDWLAATHRFYLDGYTRASAH